MKKFLLCAMLLALASPALAGTRLDGAREDAEAKARAEQAFKRLHDHPATEVVATPGLEVKITEDVIMRSCCRPPDLVVIGRVINRSPHPVDYIRFIFAFEDEQGHVVHAESVYNSRAASMGEDEQVRRVLNEKPHFTPLAPGQSDTFSMSVPLPLLPGFAKVELYSNDTEPADKRAQRD